MKITVNESLDYMRSNPEIERLMLIGLDNAKHYKKSGNRKPSAVYNAAAGVEQQMFKKVWASEQGGKIRSILLVDLGASQGVKCAARIFFGELYRRLHERKRT